MNTNTIVQDTKPLTRKQKKWRRYRQYLNKKKIEKYKKKIEKYGFGFDYDDFDEEPYYGDNGLSRLVAEQNSETYKQSMYDELDKFIAETPPSENKRQFGISCSDLYDGKKLYSEMKNDSNPNPKYEIFGSNGCGYQCFGLYKSKDKNMYIIEVQIQTPTNYIKIENENIFGYWIIK
jgi:hypothetical protein